jgi:hypothetical protein
MKKLIFSMILVTCVLYSQVSSAQNYKFGIGVRLSNASPTINNSITAKYFISPETALEGLISFGNRFGIGGLYEINKPLNFPGLQWSYGGGGYVGFQSRDTYLGPTGIIGLDYKFEKIPLNLSIDWKPELDILPKISFIPDAFGLSARFTLQ